MANTYQIILNFVEIIKKKLWLIVLLSLLFSSIVGYFVSLNKEKYISSSKIFPMSTEGASDPMSGLKAQFGISDSKDPSKYYNVNELISSRTLSRKIVTYPTNNPKYINLYTWIIDDENYGTPFYKNKIKVNKKDTLENIITASNIFKANSNITIEKNDFTTIKYTANSPELALRMNECIIQVLSDFYIESKTEKSRSDLVKIAALRDSLKYILEQSEKSQAGFEDATKYISKLTTNLPKIKQERFYGEVAEQYRAAATTYQNANYKLMYESPIFQVLDKPIPPVDIEKTSWKKWFIISFIVSFIVFSLFFLRKIILQIIIEELKGENETNPSSAI